MPRASPVMSSALAISASGCSLSAIVSVEPGRQPLLHLVALGRLQMLVADHRDLRLQPVLARLRALAISWSRQTMRPLRVSLNASFLARDDAAHAHRQLFGQHLRGGVARGLAVDAVGLAGVGDEAEALEPADEVRLDVDRAVVADIGGQLLLGAQALHQRAGAPVDEALRQLLVQRIRQRILDLARAALPVRGVLQPVGRDWTRTSTCGCARCASPACRCRRRCGRTARPAWRTSPRGCARRRCAGT